MTIIELLKTINPGETMNIQLDDRNFNPIIQRSYTSPRCRDEEPDIPKEFLPYEQDDVLTIWTLENGHKIEISLDLNLKYRQQYIKETKL